MCVVSHFSSQEVHLVHSYMQRQQKVVVYSFMVLIRPPNIKTAVVEFVLRRTGLRS